MSAQLDLARMAAMTTHPGLTHWTGCEYEHPRCAVAVLMEHVQQLRAALAQPSAEDLLDIGVQLGGFSQARAWFSRRAAAALGTPEEPK